MRKILSCLLIVLAAVTESQAQTRKAPPVAAKPQAVAIDSFINQPVYNSYYTLPRKQVSGAVSSLPGKVLENAVPTNFQALLQGKLAGVHVVQANGMPGSDFSIRVRGTSSIYGESEPLYIVDGVPVYAGPREVAPRGVNGSWGSAFNPLSDLNPNDIESVDVLKDAASAALYGSRAGNGVVVIKTKTGQMNREYIHVDYMQGVSTAAHEVSSLNGPQYLAALDQAWANSGNAGKGPVPAIAGFTRAIAEATNTDQVAQSLRTAKTRQVGFSTGYANAKTTFYFSGSYRKEEGIVTGNDLSRYTGRLRLTNQITRKLSLGVNIGMNYIDYRNMPSGYSVGGGFNAAQTNLPVYPLYDPSGRYFYASDPAVYHLPGANVAAFQNRNDFDNEEHTRRIFVAANLGYNLRPGLDLRFDAAMDQYYHSRRDYLSKRTRYGSIGSGTGREGVPTGYASFEKYGENAYNFRTTINYKKIATQYTVTGVAGIEFYYSNAPYFFAEGEGFLNEFMRAPNFANYRSTVNAAALTTNDNGFLGYFANVNYTLRNKFLLGGTARVDGSSRFGADHRYQLFTAVSAGWVLSEEKILKQSKLVSFLKLRASYGRTGNAGIGNYTSQERWELTTNSRYLLQAGIQMAGLGSPSLRPEKQDQLDLGIDFALLRHRISGTIDVYNKVTKGALLNYIAPLSAGVIEPGLLLNTGSLRNRGIELSLTSQNLSRKLGWTTTLNIAHNQNKVLNTGGLRPEQISAHTNIATYEGHAAGVFYLAEYAGVDPSNGQELIYDLNRNKVAATSAAQINSARIPHFDKPSAPKFFGGLNNSFTWRNFDLNAWATFSYGNYVLDEGERVLSYVNGKNNLRASAANAWKAEQPGTDMPRLLYNDPVSGSNTTRFLHNASYLRMKTVTLGYSLKQVLRKVKFVKSARLYVSAQNLFTITGFKGWDPEVAGYYQTSVERNLSQGITYMEVPQVRSFVAGFNVNF
jgi:TonB-linked SusC/RagA family outer membrane protein